MSQSLELVKQELEWRQCQADPFYFFENYYYIPVVGKGAALFDLRDYQREIIGSLDSNNLIISLKARQIGITTIIVGYALWHSIFHENSPWLFVSRNQDAAVKMLGRAKYAYNRLPPWMKTRIGKLVSDTQTMLEFKNASYLESVPSTGGTGRGDSVYGVVLDECAFMDYAEEIWAAVEPLTYGKAILISTANGMGNFFHDMWLDSQQEVSAWKGIFYSWDVVPSRDERWYEEKRLSFRGREWYFYQEYPANPSEAFSKSGRLAFPLDLMDYLEFPKPASRFAWISGEFYELEPHEVEDIVVDVWEEPTIMVDDHGVVRQKPNYVIGVDVAEGLDHGDYTVIKVFDSNTETEVASCRSHIPVEELGALILALGYWYHTALIVVERNNHGLVPLTYLKDHRYPRLYRLKSIARQQSSRRQEYGWYTNRKTKPKMVKDFLQALRQGVVELRDAEFKNEAQVFVADGKGSYAANDGKHDDTIMATLIAWQGVLDVGQYPVLWVDRRSRPLTFDDIFNDTGTTVGGLLDTPIGGDPVKKKSWVFLHPNNIT